MNLKNISEAIKKEPTVMNDNKEYDFLQAITDVGVDDLCGNKELFIDIVDRLVYSYRENFLEESKSMNDFFDWASKMEEIVVNEDIKTHLIFAIEEFSDDEELAESRVKTPDGLKILHS